MTDIPRWRLNKPLGLARMVKASKGGWVTYPDHVETLRQATALATPETVAQAGYWYEQGQQDGYATGYGAAMDAARQAVAALPWYAHGSSINRDDALAAIDEISRHAGAKNQQTSCADNC